MSGNRSGARLRAEAAKAIDSVVTDGRSLDVALANAEQKIGVGDRPLLRMLCYGSLRSHYRLRSQLRALLDRPLKKRDSVIESLLVVGFFQLGDTRIPDHAAVTMTVEAARLLRRPKYAGLINAVLRNFVRRKIAEQQPADDESTFNHPEWLLRRLQEDWPEDWQSIIEANNDRAPMWLRVNAQQAEAREYLAENDIDGEFLEGATHAIRLRSPLQVEELPGFAAGAVSVQDAAAQLAAPWLLAGDGMRVLDACAAPGGKTGHLLELMQTGAVLTAIDSNAERLQKVAENLDRLTLGATLLAADASKPDEWWDGEPFDRILLDAPCSATGVIRRHPDIKVLRRESDIGALATTQREILEALWITLAPGGRLLYVTCSVLSAENEAVVNAFLGAHPDAREDRVLHDYNIRALMLEKSTGFQVLPGVMGLDGFYFAALEKTQPGQ
jgi:16S rRNA (cytosine967-C5)-methyltransferase